jgi:ketosteroid isomerase-like protein
MKKTILLLSFLACFSIKNTAQTKGEKAVAEAVETLRKAMVDGDGKALTAIAADELSYGHSSGTIEDKAKFVEAFTSGKSDFVKIDLSEQTIKVAGKTAIVRHNLLGETKNAGQAPGTIKIHVMTIWQKQSGSWKLLARQAVKIP